eukprot:TRINITY_DN3659_c0_g1_i1.p1 TRINITY_DN3659_c0_g1~~TRINITY_DN3659_c0_g1_i1.p1  ORF type:complete len:689 (+),score=233.73 TRINITY_DN3659_c0_g1_i1:188-2254(+)
MKQCPSCGVEVSRPGACFCPKCGANLRSGVSGGLTATAVVDSSSSAKAPVIYQRSNSASSQSDTATVAQARAVFGTTSNATSSASASTSSPSSAASSALARNRFLEEERRREEERRKELERLKRLEEEQRKKPPPVRPVVTYERPKPLKFVHPEPTVVTTSTPIITTPSITLRKDTSTPKVADATQQTVACSRCLHQVSSKAKFCGQCGNPMALTTTSSGNLLKDGNSYNKENSSSNNNNNNNASLREAQEVAEKQRRVQQQQQQREEEEEKRRRSEQEDEERKRQQRQEEERIKRQREEEERQRREEQERRQREEDKRRQEAEAKEKQIREDERLRLEQEKRKREEEQQRQNKQEEERKRMLLDEKKRSTTYGDLPMLPALSGSPARSPISSPSKQQQQPASPATSSKTSYVPQSKVGSYIGKQTHQIEEVKKSSPVHSGSYGPTSSRLRATTVYNASPSKTQLEDSPVVLSEASLNRFTSALSLQPNNNTTPTSTPPKPVGGGIAGSTLGKLREIEKQLKTMPDDAILKGEGVKLRDKLLTLRNDVYACRDRNDDSSEQSVQQVLELYSQLSKDIPARVNQVYSDQNTKATTRYEQQRSQQQNQSDVKVVGAPCKKCGAVIGSGDGVEAVGAAFHVDCLRCYGCNRSFANLKSCLNVGGDPYCEGCGRKAFVSFTMKNRSSQTTWM